MNFNTKKEILNSEKKKYVIINKIYPKVKYRKKDHQAELQHKEIQFHTKNRPPEHQICRKIGKNNRFLIKILKQIVDLVAEKIHPLKNTQIIKLMPP